MAVRFNSLAKNKHDTLKLGAKVIIVGVLASLIISVLIGAILERNNPSMRAAARADAMIAEQSDLDLKWCLREAAGDPEKMSDCKHEYIQRETR